MNAPKLDIKQSIPSASSPIQLAKQVLQIEAQEIEALAQRLDQSFANAVQLILQCQGRVVVSGMGKSGHIARKIAATLSSTGTPAFFMHPAEANHGDLGMMTGKDILIALSHSGESEELVSILPHLKRLGAQVISLTGNTQSTLALRSDVHLDAHVSKEACSLGLAPTASTTVALALGDALAVATLDQRGFSAEDFARSHPGGSLGRKLLVRVEDVMHKGKQVPKVNVDATLKEALFEITSKKLGMTAIVNVDDQPVGIFTDGDLRRTLEKGLDISQTNIADVMHGTPKSIHQEKLATEAVKLMESHKINGLLVVNAQGKLVGALNMLDLLIAKVV